MEIIESNIIDMMYVIVLDSCAIDNNAPRLLISSLIGRVVAALGKKAKHFVMNNYACDNNHGAWKNLIKKYDDIFIIDHQYIMLVDNPSKILDVPTFLATYKTDICRIAGCKRRNCTYAHNDTEFRRSPYNAEKNYSRKLCPMIGTVNIISNVCPHVMDCDHCHNYTEYHFHPENYKRAMCKNTSLQHLDNCIYCPFLHNLANETITILPGECLSAARENHWERCLQLFNSDILDEKYPHFGETIMHYAAKYCRCDVLAVLIAHGASVNVRDVYGQMPLHKLLLSNADNPQIFTCIDMLISCGADPTVCDYHGRDAFIIAQRSANSRKLIDHISGLSNKCAKQVRQKISASHSGVVYCSTYIWVTGYPRYISIHEHIVIQLEEALARGEPSVTILYGGYDWIYDLKNFTRTRMLDFGFKSVIPIKRILRLQKIYVLGAQIEFSSRFNIAHTAIELDLDEISTWICAFLNTMPLGESGTLYFGINTAARVIGIRSAEIEKLKNSLASIDKITPRLLPEQNSIDVIPIGRIDKDHIILSDSLSIVEFNITRIDHTIFTIAQKANVIYGLANSRVIELDANQAERLLTIRKIEKSCIL